MKYLFILVLCISQNTLAQKIIENAKGFELQDADGNTVTKENERIFDVSGDTLNLYVTVNGGVHAIWIEENGFYCKSFEVDWTLWNNEEYDPRVNYDATSECDSYTWLYQCTDDDKLYVGRAPDFHFFFYHLDDKYHQGAIEAWDENDIGDLTEYEAYFSPWEGLRLIDENDKWGIRSIKGKVYVDFSYDHLHYANLYWRNEKDKRQSKYLYVGHKEAEKMWYVLDQKNKVLAKLPESEYGDFIVAHDEYLLFAKGEDLIAYNPMTSELGKPNFVNQKEIILSQDDTGYSCMVDKNNKLILPYGKHRIKLIKLGDITHIALSGRDSMVLYNSEHEQIWYSSNGGSFQRSTYGENPYYLGFGSKGSYGVLKLIGETVTVLFDPEYDYLYLYYSKKNGAIGDVRKNGVKFLIYPNGTMKAEE